jgi:hypothetical protein
MRHQYKCDICGQTGWAKGWEEFDTNAAGLLDSEPLDDACEHIQNGGSYTLIDTEYDEE